MKVVMILFDESKKNILCGGINSDRFIEVESAHSAVNYEDVENILKSVGLTAFKVNYKLLGYSSTVWVCNPVTDFADVIAEYIITGTAYNIDEIQNGYSFTSIENFIEKAQSDSNYRRLEYLKKALERMGISEV